MQNPLAHRAYDELADDGFGSDCIFYKLTLPTEESGELLRLLSVLDVDASTVFPGFSGAARVVDEMSRWPDQKSWRESGCPKEYWAAQNKFIEKHGLFPPHDTDNI